MLDPNISFLTQALGALPFCSVAGKVPRMNFTRILEALLIVVGTWQVLSVEMKAMAKVTEELRIEVKEIRLERARRGPHIDAAINELDRIAKDH